MWNINTLWFEVAVISLIFAFGAIFFGHFEEKTPKSRKALKLILYIAITTSISTWLGRMWAFGFIGLNLLAVLYIHAVVLPSKGINGLTAEPRDKYYEFRGWKT